MGISLGLWKRGSFFSHGSSNDTGVLIAFGELLDYKILSVTYDSNGRFIIINITMKGSPFILINCYAPNNENGQIQIQNEMQEQLDHLDPDQDTQIHRVEILMLFLTQSWMQIRETLN